MNVKFPNVLVVEDDPVLRRLLARMLQMAGYSVRQAANGNEALARVQEECPHFVLTDWRMPEMDGIELCDHLRKMNLPNYVYIVVITARNKSEDLVNGLAAGADDFVTKPVVAPEIVARLLTGQRILDLEQRLTKLASCDPLTGAFNRRTFYRLSDKEWSRSARYNHPLSCVMVDVDHFKKTNDTYGHLAGDAVLVTVSQLLHEGTRQSDVVCRYGGEEFCIMMPETTETNAVYWAERTRERLEAHTFDIDGQPLQVTASFGVAERTDDMENFERLLDKADRALLLAKRQGRNRVVAADALERVQG